MRDSDRVTLAQRALRHGLMAMERAVTDLKSVTDRDDILKLVSAVYRIWAGPTSKSGSEFKRVNKALVDAYRAYGKDEVNFDKIKYIIIK